MTPRGGGCLISASANVCMHAQQARCGATYGRHGLSFWALSWGAADMLLFGHSREVQGYNGCAESAVLGSTFWVEPSSSEKTPLHISKHGIVNTHQHF